MKNYRKDFNKFANEMLELFSQSADMQLPTEKDSLTRHKTLAKEYAKTVTVILL